MTPMEVPSSYKHTGPFINIHCMQKVIYMAYPGRTLANTILLNFLSVYHVAKFLGQNWSTLTGLPK